MNRNPANKKIPTWIEDKLKMYYINCAAVEQIQAEIDDLMSVGAQSYLPGYAPSEPADKVADRAHKVLALEKKRDRLKIDIHAVDLLREAVRTHRHLTDVLNMYISGGNWAQLSRDKGVSHMTLYRWRRKLIKLMRQIWQEIKK